MPHTKSLREIVHAEIEGISARAPGELDRLDALALTAFGAAVRIALLSRADPSAAAARQFRGHQARLFEAMRRLDPMLEDGELLKRWPTTPGITFCWKGGDSALAVALKFARMINTATLYGRVVAVGATLHGRPPYDLPGDATEKWCDATMQELHERTLPPLPSWPAWEIHRDSERLESLLCAEYDRCSNRPGDTAPTDLVPMSEAIRKFAVGRVALQRKVTNGKLKSYRPAHAAANAPHVFSESELARHYSRK